MNNLVHGDAGVEPRDAGRYLHIDGITDERRFYYEATGLLKQRPGQLRPNHSWVSEGLELRASGARVVVSDSTGFRGYFAGPSLHIVDVYGLSDPLLARLPACRGWRIGHFRRAIPEGYLETLSSGANQLTDPDLRAYYDVLHLVADGPLWDRKRLAGVAALVTGQYNAQLQRFIERTSPC
jgi:arabinofuranosyltransferase